MIKLESLSSAQQLVVWSARSWVRGFNTGEPTLQLLEPAYALTGIQDTARDVDDFFGIFSSGARFHLCFGAPHCPAVHAIEANLVNCLSTLQAGDFGHSAHILGGVLHTQSAVRAAVPAYRWAVAMKEVGWSLDCVSMKRAVCNRRQDAKPHMDEGQKGTSLPEPLSGENGGTTPPPGATIH